MRLGRTTLIATLAGACLVGVSAGLGGWSVADIYLAGANVVGAVLGLWAWIERLRGTDDQPRAREVERRIADG